MSSPIREDRCESVAIRLRRLPDGELWQLARRVGEELCRREMAVPVGLAVAEALAPIGAALAEPVAP